MKKKILTVSVLAIFSILFWFSIALNNDYLYVINSKINLQDLPQNYSISVQLPEEVSITLKGSGWNLLKYTVFEKEDFVISIHRKLGKKKIELKDFVKSNNWLSSNFQVIDINPSTLDIDLERSISKTVRIYPVIKLEFEEGYDIVSEIELEPAFVEVKGAPSLLKNIDSVFTINQEFFNIKDNFNVKVPLKIIKGTEYSSNYCNLKFEVQKIVDNNFENVPVKVINLPKDQELILYPSKVNLLLKSGINILGKLNIDSINVYVDFEKINKDENYVVPQVELPKFVKLISIEPNNLEFVIKKN
ncbi:MAG: hypothetical protein N2321_06630 [Melioribacteraceae bacterium]|nr:hypothetical protein [Melioribacteraceae bacterium]